MPKLIDPLSQWTTSPEPSVALKFEIQQALFQRGSKLRHSHHHII